MGRCKVRDPGAHFVIRELHAQTRAGLARGNASNEYSLTPEPD
jgi:hypothetical protein